MEELVALLSSCQFSVDSEVELQNQIEQVFIDNNIKYERESTITGGYIDFIVDKIGIEVKIKGQKRTIYHQCKQYLTDDKINSILIVTNVPMSLPDEIEEKKTHVLNLGAAWL